MRLRFWGVRGSIPAPGPDTNRYGGNTSCVSLTTASGALFIIDLGTGAMALGNGLMATEFGKGQGRATIFLSHAHWDHIQGLPHFKPFFSPGSTVRIWGSRQGTVSLEAILRQQMDPAVFPVPLDALSARLTVQHIEPGEFTIGAFRVNAMRLRHPGMTLGYRLAPVAGGPSLAYVTDNELGDGGDHETVPRWRSEFIRFLSGVDVLIHDAMYTPEELETHRGWGHSTFEEAVGVAAEAGVKRLVLFHHEPEHGDAVLDDLLEEARRLALQGRRPSEILAAQEGMTLTL